MGFKSLRIEVEAAARVHDVAEELLVLAKTFNRPFKVEFNETVLEVFPADVLGGAVRRWWRLREKERLERALA